MDVQAFKVGDSVMQADNNTSLGTITEYDARTGFYKLEKEGSRDYSYYSETYLKSYCTLVRTENPKTCPPHKYRGYVGFRERYAYCENCDSKRDWDWWTEQPKRKDTDGSEYVIDYRQVGAVR